MKRGSHLQSPGEHLSGDVTPERMYASGSVLRASLSGGASPACAWSLLGVRTPSTVYDAFGVAWSLDHRRAPVWRLKEPGLLEIGGATTREGASDRVAPGWAGGTQSK